MGKKNLDLYPPELFNLWKIATQEEIVIPMPSEAKAKAFRQRLYRMRIALHANKHPLYIYAQNCELQATEDSLIIRPLGASILPYLKDAGLLERLQDGGEGEELYVEDGGDSTEGGNYPDGSSPMDDLVANYLKGRK